jgi:hypothetical protein
MHQQPHTDEAKRKISAALTGRKHDESRKMKMRESWARRKAAGLPGRKSGGADPKADVTE